MIKEKLVDIEGDIRYKQSTPFSLSHELWQFVVAEYLSLGD